MCFPKNFANVFRTPILEDADGRLPLYLLKIKLAHQINYWYWRRKFEKKKEIRTVSNRPELNVRKHSYL